jgi:hypothetical protein
MNFPIHSSNPAVKAIVEGTAPQPARMAAARGILPLPPNDLLEVLVGLASVEGGEISELAAATLRTQREDMLAAAVQTEDIAPSVLGHVVNTPGFSGQLLEQILLNPRTPVEAVAMFASTTSDGSLLELIAVNQQLLIAQPAIIDAIVANPNSTPEAVRRASETRKEFFEKERGAEQVAEELRARGQDAAAEFFENAEGAGSLSVEEALLIAKHIEVPDSEVDDSWLSLEYLEELYEETPEQREAVIRHIVGELGMDGMSVGADRVAVLTQILRMNMKDRMKLAMKGDREAREILIRDPNRIVAKAVIENPRITEQEVEKIAAMRSAPEEIIRHIANNRQWARNYPIMHNLARNPRTPMQQAFSILTRLQMRDLQALSKNRNVSEAVRKQALRLVSTRTGN